MDFTFDFEPPKRYNEAEFNELKERVIGLENREIDANKNILNHFNNLIEFVNKQQERLNSNHKYCEAILITIQKLEHEKATQDLIINS